MKNFCIAGFVVFVSIFFSSCTDSNLDELVEINELQNIENKEIGDDDEGPLEGER